MAQTHPQAPSLYDAYRPETPEDRKARVYDNFDIKTTNPIAKVATRPAQVVLDSVAQMYAEAGHTKRSAFSTGYGPALSHKDRLSLNAVDDYNSTISNLGALAGSAELSLSLTPDFSIDPDGAISAQAPSLFEGSGHGFLNNPAPMDDAYARVTISGKGILSADQVTLSQHNIEALNRQHSSARSASAAWGYGGVLDVDVPTPFGDVKGSAGYASVYDASFFEARSSTGAGIVAEGGIYGLSAGFEYGGRLAALRSTNYGVLDTDFGVRSKNSIETTGIFGGGTIGLGGLLSWDDNTGTLTYEVSASAAALVGGKVGFAGETQIEAAAGIVEGLSDMIDDAADALSEFGGPIGDEQMPSLPVH